MPNTAAPDQAQRLRECQPARGPWTIAITSGKGGVGKTSLAVNLAVTLAQSGRRTCLVDGDLGLANVDVMLNLHPRHSLRDVVTAGMPVEEIILQGPAGLEVIPAASGVEALADLSVVARQFLVKTLQSLSLRSDITVLDTGAGVSKTVLALTLAADQVLVVTTPEPTAITDAYAMVKILSHRRPSIAISLVVNQVEHAGQAREVHGHLHKIIQRFLQRDVPMAGWIPRDACVERAVREQRPMAVYFPYARASEAIQGLAARLASLDRPVEGRPFWQRLVESADAV